MYVCMYVCVYVCMYVCIYVCMYVYVCNSIFSTIVHPVNTSLLLSPLSRKLQAIGPFRTGTERAAPHCPGWCVAAEDPRKCMQRFKQAHFEQQQQQDNKKWARIHLLIKSWIIKVATPNISAWFCNYRCACGRRRPLTVGWRVGERGCCVGSAHRLLLSGTTAAGWRKMDANCAATV